MDKETGELNSMKANNKKKVILSCNNIVKKFGRVVALDNANFNLFEGEILGIIGDNGAGKSTLIKALSGAITIDAGEIFLNEKKVQLNSPSDARLNGIETVYQNLALSPALSIIENMFLGREIRKKNFLGKVFRSIDKKKMKVIAKEKLNELGILTVQNINQAIETLSGGQRQAVAIARASLFGSKIIILDEPTAALGVKESRKVLELIKNINQRGISIILISHNMPHVFEICHRVHIHRLSKKLCDIDPKKTTMEEAVALMTGAKQP